MLKQLWKYDVMTSYLDHLAENDTALQEELYRSAPLCERTEKERAIETEVIDSFPKKSPGLPQEDENFSDDSNLNRKENKLEKP